MIVKFLEFPEWQSGIGVEKPELKQSVPGRNFNSEYFRPDQDPKTAVIPFDTRRIKPRNTVREHHHMETRPPSRTLRVRVSIDIGRQKQLLLEFNKVRHIAFKWIIKTPEFGADHFR